MSDKIETTIKIDSWDEKPTQEFDDGTKVAHAVVGLTEGNDGPRTGHMESVLYYRADGTSTYLGAIRLEAELDGRKGAFTAIGEGEYDGTTASSTHADRRGHGRPGRHHRHGVEQLDAGRTTRTCRW